MRGIAALACTLAVLTAAACSSSATSGDAPPSSTTATSAATVPVTTTPVTTAPTSTSASSTTADVPGYTNPEVADAKAIASLAYKSEPDHDHIEGVLTYDSSPPMGGNHSQFWADCSGTVYPQAIANENAVHALEHGAVWITYRPGLPADQVAILAKQVTGVDRLLLSPYPGLKTKVSVQSWDYQVFVDSASDPRIAQFISVLRFNPKTTPEPQATCSQPAFIAHPSAFGAPLWVPAS